MSNNPLNPTAMFQNALRHKNAEEAWSWAQRLKPLYLADALSLTVLLGLSDDARYRPAAERFIERYAEEANPTPEHEAKVREDLDRLVRVCPVVLKYAAGEDLREVAKQLEALSPQFVPEP